ncbi:MAG TPA: histidine--tRNA ligase [Candidatus Eisenbacteria bacterium]|jgi:histidyl-tRNA synthetase|nr:histidine--tRNA ligase [Candidatus Eisenbacteria bacterium]
MAIKSKFQAIRGTRDLLPPETVLWNRVEETARHVFATFGFGEIRPPVFEPTELFARSIGEDTDVVGKEMYSFPENPGWAELEQLRTFCGDMYVKYKETQHADLFLMSVVDFLSRIGSMVKERLLNLSSSLSSDRVNLEQLIEQYRNDGDAKCLSSINLKIQTFRFVESVSLRPEATASVCRAYIEHNMQQLPQPVKLYYMGPMFRRERPQKGRYRQFYQIGAEVLEAVRLEAANQDVAKEIQKDATTDAEVIEMVMTFFDRLQLPGVQLEINSIGHAADNCRRGYVATLKSALEKVKNNLGADSQRRIETNALRVLDSKLEHEQPIIETLPRIVDHLCDDCKAHYAAVRRQLEMRGVLYRENWRLVRGLDYYMRTTFEITAQGLGSQNAVCGGGRYDGLVELLGGPPSKGIGFAIGEDRLILSMQEGGNIADSAGRAVYIAWMGEHAHATAIRAAKDLRNAGFSVELPPVEQKFGKALERASKLNSRYALILGDNEVAEGSWTLKTLADGTQQKFTEPELLDFLKRHP